MAHSSWSNPLEFGEHKAFGPTKRRDISGPDGHLAQLEEFEGHSLRAEWVYNDRNFVPPSNKYFVWSYSTVIAIYNPRDNSLYLNEAHYSNKTTEHQHTVAAWLAHPHNGPVVVADGETALVRAAFTL